MRYSEARPGRIFVMRLEDGEILHATIEAFAAAQGIKAAGLLAIGGADCGSRLVVGPQDGRAAVISPMELVLDNVHEVAGVGTLFPGEDGRPVLHMHLAAGRGERSVAGCVRRGVRVWQVLEVIVNELSDTDACRRHDPVTGFQLLAP